jgi:hypothetical protein
MRSPSCHFGPFLLAILVLSSLAGCYRSHAAGFECDCCGVALILSDPAACTPLACAPICASVGDTGVRRDVGRPDTSLPTECGERPLDLLCFDHIRAETPTDVTIALGLDASECFCDQELTCEVSLLSPLRLELSTALCPETPVCRACGGPPVATCRLPALPEGVYGVYLNGERSMQVTVTPIDVFPERADVCIRRSIVDSCGTTGDIQSFEVGRACHEEAAPPGVSVPIRVYDACGGCWQRGPCEVTVFDDIIRVRATRMPNSCDIACPPVCQPDEHVCLTPPLAPGSYRVLIDGLPVDENTTIDIAPGASGGEVCAGG